MGPKVNWTWRPDEARKKLFDEWRNITIGYLVSTREGTGVLSLPNNLLENTGEIIPLEKMGFRTIQQFLYEMRNDLEVGLFNGKLFIFVREADIPPNMQNIRDLVLGQAKDNGCKRGGVIKRPTKAQSSICSPEDLFLPWHELASRAPTTSSSGAGATSSRFSGSSQFPSANAPRRHIHIQGLILSDEDSDSDDDGFDFYTCPPGAKDKADKDKLTYSATKVTKVEPSNSEPKSDFTASSSPAHSTSLSDKPVVKPQHVRRNFVSWSYSDDDSDCKDNVRGSQPVALVSVEAQEPVQYIWKGFGERTSDESETEGNGADATTPSKVDKTEELSTPLEAGGQPQPDAKTEGRSSASESGASQDEIGSASRPNFPDLDMNSDESIDAFIAFLESIQYEYPWPIKKLM